MLKYILGLTMITLVGCSASDSTLKQRINDLRESNDALQSKLNTCEARLDMSGSSTSQSYSEPEPEAPAEPQYEEVEYAQLLGKSHKCYEREAEACGMSFSECSDGLVYRCMKDAVYKIGIEKKLVE